MMTDEHGSQTYFWNIKQICIDGIILDKIMKHDRSINCARSLTLFNKYRFQLFIWTYFIQDEEILRTTNSRLFDEGKKHLS